ncbi:VOC family protein [Streptomyces triticagri]|uniref:VOC family protein n=1 Tax=Streptomyces triticagri TaxID=2293568 RepID=A0A372M3U5_9ACTN|nr:VOC family protein [Streptomyces triticagri]RFU85582.1 VOC family protein [Streptomyces triticagri]
MPDTHRAPARFKDLALDARDHHALADWWCETLGYVRRDPGDGTGRPRAWPVPIEDPSGAGPLIWINPVPETNTAKNRMHLDVWGDPARLVSLGATLLREPDDDVFWHVLADPEGNEFCVFAPEGEEDTEG